MPNPIKKSISPKTKINYFYLVRQFPLLTFLHYLTGFLSAYGSAKILTKITKFVNDKDKSVNIGQIKSNFWEIIGRFLIAYGFIVLIHIAMEIWLVEVYSSHLRKKLAQKHLNANFSQSQKSHFILTNYQSEAINAGTKAAQIFNRCFYSIVSIFFIFWELGKDEKSKWLISWLLMALLVLTVVALLLYQLTYRPRFRRTKDIQQENKHFEELKTNIEYIKVSGTEKKEIAKNDNLVSKNLKKIFPLVSGKTLFATIPNYLLVEIIPLPFLLVADTGGVISLFVLYTKLNVLFKNWKKFFEELWAKGGYDGYCSSLQQLNNGFAILEKNVYPAPKIYLLPAKKLNIAFENVDFVYPEDKKKVLVDFSFNFQQGTKYAIIGPNGIGKSTLFKLILKLYQPESGEIRLGQTDLKEIDSSLLAKKVFYLSNQSFFFNDTVANNIMYPDVYQKERDHAKLIFIAKELGILELINKLPHSWETIIEEKGNNLSEGQKQLISLIRMFVNDYEVYLLDEILNNVNSEHRKKLLEIIFRKLKDKTIIFITHNQEDLKHGEEIYTFTNQKLIKN